MNILINKDNLMILKESIEAQKISRDEFIKEVKSFLYEMLSNNHTINKGNFWGLNGLRNSEVLNKLLRFGLVERKLELSEDTGLTEIKLMVPKKNFERKVDRLYYDMFPEQELVTEDGEGGGDMGGVNTCSSVGGSFEIPFMSPINRKIGGL